MEGVLTPPPLPLDVLRTEGVVMGLTPPPLPLDVQEGMVMRMTPPPLKMAVSLNVAQIASSGSCVAVVYARKTQTAKMEVLV